MPFMQRLTWGGVALHAGFLPGYPASHGCVRLPKAFAELLYGVTRHGSAVVVLDEEMGSGAWLQRDLLVTSAPVQGRARHASRDSAVESASAAATARLNRAMLAQLTGRTAPATATSTIATLESDDMLSTGPRLQ